MKKRTAIFSFLILFLVVFSFTTIKHNNTSIDEIFSNEAYAYLPLEAKEYVKEIYEETGNIILTEKNKKGNTPYLNPQYAEYLSLSEEEKEKVSLIPEVYTVDFIYNSASTDTELPKTYDLRNVNGKNFTTPLKDQKNLNVCWAFATVEQAESYLMVTNNTPYNNTTQKFSVRQMDYALSNDGISNYDNKYGYRKLGDGGNFIHSSKIMSVGLSLIDDNIFPYDEDMTPKKISDVLNYNNSWFELNETIRIPNISTTLAYDNHYQNLCNSAAADYDECYDQAVEEIKQMYIHQIKSNIMKYGGGIVETVSPQSHCSFKNTDGSYATEINGRCYSLLEAHAMQVIGWDDDYEYSYCEENGVNYPIQNGTCSQGTYVTGQGAWLLRNSWGNNSDYGYVYLTYDSIQDDINSSPDFGFITSLTSSSERTWDNSYSEQEKSLIRNEITQSFKKRINTPEKIEKIKFYSFGQNATYSFSIHANNRTYGIEKVTTDYPGLHTIDLSSYNIVIDSETFSVTASSANSYMPENSISVFTSNINKEPFIMTNDIVVDQPNFMIFSDTKNINSNEQVSYRLFDGEKELIGYLQVTNNEVAANEINANAKLIKKLPKGEYTLQMKYHDYDFNTKLKVEDLLMENAEVTFKPNFDTQVNDYTQIFDTSLAAKLDENQFTREGFRFTGWNTKADGTGTSYQNNEVIQVTSDMILYAQWEELTYTITFNANTGAGTMNDIIASASESISLPTWEFTKLGYRFTGWNTKADGTGISYQNHQVIQVTSNMILYAQWEAKTYTVNYEFNLKDVGGNISTQTFTYDIESKLKDYPDEEEGYIFLGWGTQTDGKGTNYSPGQIVKNLTTSSSISLYTLWIPITYQIKFHSNNNENLTVDQTLTYDVEDNLIESPFIKNGYQLKEWNTKSDGTGVSYQNQQQVVNLLNTQDDMIHLYAIWEQANGMITYHSNDGTNKKEIQNFSYQTDIKIKSNCFARDGYIFKGWNTSSDGTGTTYLEDQIISLNQNLTLYAIWEQKTGTITYYSNDGTNKKETQNFPYQTDTQIKSNCFVRDGYIFKSWNTSPDGTGTMYTANQTVRLKENISLYAIWVEAYDYKINYYKIDSIHRYIENIQINTTFDMYQRNFILNQNYRLEVEYKTLNSQHVLYTGGFTKIYKNNNLYAEYIHVVDGDTNGDGKINYLDYVNVYNHIQKVKHPESNKKALQSSYLVAADMSKDGKINYLDYVKIYNKIKELKGAK